MHTVRRLRITQRFRSSNANADSSAIENLHFQNPPLIKNYAISALQIPQASVIALHARIGKFIMDATESENCEPMTQPATRRCGILIILSSPSGAGKTTLARKLIEWDPQIEFSVSATTRPPRPGETEGREYHFVSNEEFQRMIKQGELLEFASVFGNLYGTLAAQVERAVLQSRDIIFDIDWQGGEQLRRTAHSLDIVSIFVLPPSIRELRQRLALRGKDLPANVDARMSQSKTEISHWLDYDYVLINSDFDDVLSQIKSIVLAERLKRHRQPRLRRFVDKLNHEFESGQEK